MHLCRRTYSSRLSIMSIALIISVIRSVLYSVCVPTRVSYIGALWSRKKFCPGKDFDRRPFVDCPTRLPLDSFTTKLSQFKTLKKRVEAYLVTLIGKFKHHGLDKLGKVRMVAVETTINGYRRLRLVNTVQQACHSFV